MSEPSVVTIRDGRAGTTARILVSQGFNCFAFEGRLGGQPVDVLYAREGIESGEQRPSSSGIPLLFPFPGRIAGGVLSWEDREYRLVPEGGPRHAIHGLVYNRAWRVTRQDEHEVVGEFHLAQDGPGNGPLPWPADFRIEVRYSLEGNCLRGDVLVENLDACRLPCGLGAHPYFRVSEGSGAAECRVRIPATEHWELEELIPTGRRERLATAADFQRGLRLSEMQFDDVFGGMVFEQGVCTAVIDDPARVCRVEQRWSDDFPYCVVYNPPHREAVCIEPYSCIPDAFRLTAQGIECGLRVLEPEATWQSWFEIEVDERA